MDESIAWMKDCAADVRERSKRLFRYLSGAPLPPPPLRSQPSQDLIDVPKRKEEGAWSFAGLFSGLRGPKESHTSLARDADSQTWSDGEIHADLIRVRLGRVLSTCEITL